MKINPTDRCLSLVLQTLEDVILPELRTPQACDALTNINATLLDLLKRQGASRDLLAQCIEQGEKLYQDAYHALMGEEPDRVVTRPDGSFDVLLLHHEDLTRRLQEVGQSLANAEVSRPENLQLLRKAAEWELSYYKSLPKIAAGCSNGSHNTGTSNLSSDALGRFLSSQDPGSVVSLTPITGGFGKQTFACSFQHEDQSIQNLIIRKEDRYPINQHHSFLLEQEFSLVSILHKTGYPCPEPFSLGLNVPGIDTTFYTMRRIDGTPPGSWLGGHKQKISEQTILHMAELLGRLHSVPLDIFSDHIARFDSPAALNETVEERYRRNLETWFDYIDRVDHPPSPMLVWMLQWLSCNIPADKSGPVLTHGDYSFHNMLARDNQIVGVLDWECADFGAPEQDIAYVKPHVEPHIEWERFIAHYHLHGGRQLNDDHMTFYGIWSTMRAFMGGLKGAMNLQTGLTDDLRYIHIEQGFYGGLMEQALNYRDKTQATGI